MPTIRWPDAPDWSSSKAEAITARVEPVQDAVSDANEALWDITQGAPDAQARFNHAHQVFRDRLQSYTETAEQP
ncbi:hypothetical protein EDD27_0206 [Nonomuraea polychroma]|uniref:Uncharacterized protein n=1 Tax=Nonomuraea polychroma TaxID=46176 RepID=A0A438LX38_9ACTN|nr:hypothetical protein [Nonomuraea polychroma]RVX37917.1 hypothetical protein EDD27_0206 [Nonomuraea polychroma]